jgi:hypothetical protein
MVLEMCMRMGGGGCRHTTAFRRPNVSWNCWPSTVNRRKMERWQALVVWRRQRRWWRHLHRNVPSNGSRACRVAETRAGGSKPEFGRLGADRKVADTRACANRSQVDRLGANRRASEALISGTCNRQHSRLGNRRSRTARVTRGKRRDCTSTSRSSAYRYRRRQRYRWREHCVAVRLL